MKLQSYATQQPFLHLQSAFRNFFAKRARYPRFKRKLSKVSEEAKYQDIRSDFWRACWVEAASYDAYLEGSDTKRAGRWPQLKKRIPALSEAQKKRVSDYGRRLNILLVSGVWCGDCVRQGPMIRQIADACDESVELRVIDRDVNHDLRDEVRILGAARVPVVVFLSEDFHEAGRFGDRLLETYRRKARTEIGPACAVPMAEIPPEELAAERDEWLDIFERMLLMVRLAPPLRARYRD